MIGLIISLAMVLPASADSTIVPLLVDIPAGSFVMGSERGGEDADEAPLKTVQVEAFRMGATEITNAQFERFRPGHRVKRGIGGFSIEDDEAVVNVTWHDAMDYCRWLSERTGRIFRLPTEEEWEYACRAGTTTDYWTGDTLPKNMWKNQQTERDKVVVSLRVGQNPPNPWGLYDMHGNVEEWCINDYGFNGEGLTAKATRGGSHNTPVRYLRSANRSAMLADDASVMCGFRIIEVTAGNKQPVFMTPIPYVTAPDDDKVPFYSHNHQPAITYTPDGGLLAIWFSCDEESGREMVVLQSRLKPGSENWTPAELFFKVADRNVTGSSLLTLPDGGILHMNGVSDAGDWKHLALCRRFINGKTDIVAPDHDIRHQVVAGPIITKDGRILQCCDAGPGGEDGTALWVSRDWGNSWEDTGSTIAGIHAGIVELNDGALLAFGRGQSIMGEDGKPHMPYSLSRDGGYTWEYGATEFDPIGSGQRLVLRRLIEGPLMLVSFGNEGMFAALSYDEGETWPVRKLMTDGSGQVFEGGAWTGSFTMDATHAEPKGYLACTQTSDGIIHLLSSRLHYRFNLEWLEEKRSPSKKY